MARLLTLKDAGIELFGQWNKTVEQRMRRMRARDQLKVTRVNRRLYVPRAEIDRLASAKDEEDHEEASPSCQGEAS